MSDLEYMARVRAMERSLYRVARSMLGCDEDSADAIQEAVFKGWMKRQGLREEKYFETWMIRILINECRNVLRQRRRAPLPLNEEVQLCAASDPDGVLHLRRCLEAMPVKLRAPLVLHHLEGYGVSDVARMLNIAPSLAKSRLHQARRTLKKSLCQGDEPR